MSYSQKNKFQFFPYFCVKWALNYPTRNKTPKNGFLATFLVAPSHPTKFQPNRWQAANTLLDSLKNPLLSNGGDNGRLNTSSHLFHAYYIGRGGEEGGQGGFHDRPEGRAIAGLKAIMNPPRPPSSAAKTDIIKAWNDWEEVFNNIILGLELSQTHFSTCKACKTARRLRRADSRRGGSNRQQLWQQHRQPHVNFH